MSKVNFFTELSALMQDKESIDLKIQKTGEELTVLLVPKIKGKTATITMSGSAEDLNEGFMSELIKPIEKINGLISTASEVEIKDAEDDEETEDVEKSEVKKSTPKKLAPKKASKKVEIEKSEDEVEVIVTEGKSTDEIESELEKEHIESEEAEKLAAEQIAIEKAEQEAREVKQKEEFNHLIKLGDESLEARKYEDAEMNYEMATRLFPDHKEAHDKFIKAKKWVNQLIEAGILSERKEVSHGA